MMVARELKQDLKKIILDIYEDKESPVSVDQIFSVARKRDIHDFDIRNGVKSLKDDPDLKFRNRKFVPRYSYRDLKHEQVDFNLSRVRKAIKSFKEREEKYPKSSEIVEEFKDIFGEPTAKDPDRKVRAMYEEGKLVREEKKDIRYKIPEGTENQNQYNLQNFIL